MNTIHQTVASLCGLPPAKVSGTITLLDEGATVPFISRYRKEATGGLDEVEINSVRETLEKVTELEKRKETILRTIEEQGALTDQLRERIVTCWDSAILEDIYLPYKPKRRTRATMAREKGLEPLAAIIMRQDGSDPERTAGKFLGDKVGTVEEALAGASDIIAEWAAERERVRSGLRSLFAREAIIRSKVVKGKELEAVKYSDYFEMETPLRRIPSHRLMAMVRGEKEGFLSLGIAPEEEKALDIINRAFIKGDSPARELIEAALKDSYRRLLRSSMETESMSQAKEKADTEAIAVFAGNLRQLLLMPPLGGRRVLAIDPGFRTGCKVVCLDEQGNLLHNETIYPHEPQRKTKESVAKLNQLIESYRIDTIAIGDGTAGRETERMVKDMRFHSDVKVFMVSEDGASVYSASAVAREEFPDYNVTVRGAVSIGRRLMDPLSELVKIDPKAIGVGQYQHDVDQGRLKKELDIVVESCVNHVGVNLNTASKHLLAYVSGLGPVLASNIVEYRKEHGGFGSREELKKVPRLGAKAFEQCAGFLRIPESGNPLDNTAVHPESYHVVEKIARDNKVSVSEFIADKAVRNSTDLSKYVTASTGLPTLQDIMRELEKPGRDPRGEVEEFEFSDISSIDDLREGMVVPGIVSNITAFGAFVDIGVKQDGLVHISQLADKYVSDPAEVVKLHQKVMVRVMEVDIPRKRISLSMKNAGN